MNKKILIIDDGNVEAEITFLKDNGFYCNSHNFDDIERTLKKEKPDFVILDYKRDREELAGKRWFDYIWTTKIFPILFYTAFYEELEEYLKRDGFINHPLIYLIKKGSGAGKNLLEHLNQAEGIIDILDSCKKDFLDNFDKSRHETLKTTIAFFDKKSFIENPSRIKELIIRRLARSLDQIIKEPIEPFEMYIFPPVNDSLLVGDILMHIASNEFFVILTPSCDMVLNRDHNDKIHICKLEQCKNMVDQSGLKDCKDPNKFIESIKSGILNGGFKGKNFPLPPLIKYFKTPKSVNLTNCSYIDINDIQNSQNSDNKKPYQRIASLDNPFRETLVWAYMTINCRPGLPERNLDSWGKSIFENYIEKNESN